MIEKRKKLYTNITFAFLCALAALFLVPIALVFINSFKSRLYVSSAPFALPFGEMGVGLENYINGLSASGFLQSFLRSVFISVAGVLLIILPGLLKFLIPIFFGAWILLSSVSGMYRNFTFRSDHHFWWIGLILSTLGAGLGIYIITRPMTVMDSTIRLIGIALIVFAVLRLVSLFMARHYFTAPSTGDVIDVTPHKD